MLGGKYKLDWQAFVYEDVRDKVISSCFIYAIYWSQSASLKVEYLPVLMS